VPAWMSSLPPATIAENREMWLDQWRAAVGR
jgi:thiamine transport system substrate-binding protein